MFLLAYRSSKHETVGLSPAEFYYARDFRLPLDLLQGNSPGLPEQESQSVGNYVENLRERLGKIHAEVRERMSLRFSRMKACYDKKARQVSFEEGQRVWLFNPQKRRGRAPKLQSNWEGPYTIVKKLSDVVFCIRKTLRHREKVIHADRLASYLERRSD